MIQREEVDGLRSELLGLLAREAHDSRRLIEGLERLGRERGSSPHAALLLLLTRLPFEESEARRHWHGIAERQRELARALDRDPGIRAAVLDYFVHGSGLLRQPRLVDLDLTDAEIDPTRDEKTGLANDRAFRTVLEREVRRSRRHGERVALALFDLDGFATLNRRSGATVGDRLLREAAQLLSHRTRPMDLAARPGEDELAVLLPETDRRGAGLVAERFRRAIEAFFRSREVAGGPVGLTVSGGVAVCPEDATDPDGLVRCAAQALYVAKARGKNVIEAYRGERRRHRRVDLDAARFEVDVQGAVSRRRERVRDASRAGVRLLGPESREVGESIEIRLDPSIPGRSEICLRGAVARVAALGDRPAGSADRFEIGVDLDATSADGILEFLEILEPAGRRGDGRG